MKLERFLLPFLRMVTDDRAEIQFKLEDEELLVRTIDYSTGDNRWTVTLRKGEANGAVG